MVFSIYMNLKEIKHVKLMIILMTMIYRSYWIKKLISLEFKNDLGHMHNMIELRTKRHWWQIVWPWRPVYRSIMWNYALYRTYDTHEVPQLHFLHKRDLVKSQINISPHNLHKVERYSMISYARCRYDSFGTMQHCAAMQQ